MIWNFFHFGMIIDRVVRVHYLVWTLGKYFYVINRWRSIRDLNWVVCALSQHFIVWLWIVLDLYIWSEVCFGLLLFSKSRRRSWLAIVQLYWVVSLLWCCVDHLLTRSIHSNVTSRICVYGKISQLLLILDFSTASLQASWCTLLLALLNWDWLWMLLKDKLLAYQRLLLNMDPSSLIVNNILACLSIMTALAIIACNWIGLTKSIRSTFALTNIYLFENITAATSIQIHKVWCVYTLVLGCTAIEVMTAADVVLRHTFLSVVWLFISTSIRY